MQEIQTVGNQGIQTPSQEMSLILKALESEGVNDTEIAKMLAHIMKDAVIQNNKGDVIEAFDIKLKAVQTILKLKDKNFNSNNINIGFFMPPSIDNLKY